MGRATSASGRGSTSTASWRPARTWAGDFDGQRPAVGDLYVSGTITKGGGGFRIDHPLDPADRYLSHSFVESPEMLNVYAGTAVTDGDGEAAVALPDYFEALNRDHRFQLTPVGQLALATVDGEVSGNALHDPHRPAATSRCAGR